MTDLRASIREANRLKRMRLGQQVPEPIELPSFKEAGIRVVMVPLNEAEAQQGVLAAAALDVPDNQAGFSARTRVAQQTDVWLAMRDPANTDSPLFASVEEMTEELDPRDIDYASDFLAVLMDYASPEMDGITPEMLAELEKGWAAIRWSELTGQQWAAVKLASLTLFPELLQARLSGSTSTESSTERNDDDSSTGTA